MSGTQVPAGSTDNYTIGGARIVFAERISVGVYDEYRDLGNIVSASIASEIDRLQHFTAKTGTRAKDREVVRETSFNINFTFDEPNVDNLNLMFLADGRTTVAAVTTAVVDETHVVDGTREFMLSKLISATGTIVVKNNAGAVTYTLNTDYTIRVVGLQVFIRPILTTIVDGDTLKVSYTPNEPAFEAFAPLSQTDRPGRAWVTFASDTGNEFIWKIGQCSLAPNGEFTYNDQDWSTFPMTLSVESDGTSYPYGRIYHAGVGAGL